MNQKDKLLETLAASRMGDKFSLRQMFYDIFGPHNQSSPSISYIQLSYLK